MKKTIHTKEQIAFVGRLRRARQESNFTQLQVAKKLGCTQSYISKIESGELKIDVLELQKLSKIYGQDIRYFVR